MSGGTPNVTCCGRPVVWMQDDEFWISDCGRCGRLFSFFEPGPPIPAGFLRGYGA